jgi:hypothetical protein
MNVKLWDGTTVINSAHTITGGISLTSAITVAGFITNPVGNLRISVRDSTNTTGAIIFNSSGNSRDSHITAIRIA